MSLLGSLMGMIVAGLVGLLYAYLVATVVSEAYFFAKLRHHRRILSSLTNKE